MRINVSAAWHSDLIHLNKVRDDHVLHFAKLTQMTLYEPHNAKIEDHVLEHLSTLKRAPKLFSIRPLIYLYWWLDVVVKQKGRLPNIILGLHGSEPAARILALFANTFLVQDVWDLPGASVGKGARSRLLTIYGWSIWAFS